MAIYHVAMKSGKKGAVAEHVRYVTRQGKFRSRTDLVHTHAGNLPEWACGDPLEFFRAADKHERANGAPFREYEIALPAELNQEQHKDLADRLAQRLVGDKPYLYAIHEPEASLGGVRNPHMHLMFSDRLPDGITRTPEQTFARYNPRNPEKGGCKKDSGGKSRSELRDAARAQRRLIAEIQNEVLAEVGETSRVDHRSYAERGVRKTPEQHLGPARIRRMTSEEKADYMSFWR